MSFIRSVLALAACVAMAASSVDASTANQRAKPTFLMHGYTAWAARDFALFTPRLLQAFPGTQIFPITLFEGLGGLVGPARSGFPLNEQVPAIIEYIRETVNANPALFANGYNLIGHSQGGLITRAIVQEMDDHKIETYISVAGVQAGIFFPTPNPTLPLDVDTVLSFPIQTGLVPELRNFTSVFNMYRNPFEYEKYRAGNVFQPRYNNEQITPNATEQARFARNANRVKRFIAIGSPADEVIFPPETAVFSFLNSTGQVVPLKEGQIWKNNAFGIQQLEASGKLKLISVENVCHTCWLRGFEEEKVGQNGFTQADADAANARIAVQGDELFRDIFAPILATSCPPRANCVEETGRCIIRAESASACDAIAFGAKFQSFSSLCPAEKKLANQLDAAVSIKGTLRLPGKFVCTVPKC